MIIIAVISDIVLNLWTEKIRNLFSRNCEIKLFSQFLRIFSHNYSVLVKTWEYVCFPVIVNSLYPVYDSYTVLTDNSVIFNSIILTLIYPYLHRFLPIFYFSMLYSVKVTEYSVNSAVTEYSLKLKITT